MMPDNNEASASSAAKADSESPDNVVSIQGGPNADSDEPGAVETKTGAQSDKDAELTASEEILDEALAEAIEAEPAADEDAAADPLGFGDQRMGEGDQEEPLGEVESLQAQLTAAEARAAENWDRLLRLQAEMENQRKRAQNDVTKARKFALESIVSDLLPVKDTLEMGLAAAQAEDADLKSIIEGSDLTLKMLAQVFEKNNIVEVNPVDEKFDPEFHQAMSMQEIEGKAANTVASVMQKGYTLNDRLVRPALVMVAK